MESFDDPAKVVAKHDGPNEETSRPKDVPSNGPSKKGSGPTPAPPGEEVAREESTKPDSRQRDTTPPPFPTLSNTPNSPEMARHGPLSEGDDEEMVTAKSFDRSQSPTHALQRNRGAFVEKVGDDGVCRMHKFSLYETAMYFYIVGGDLLDQRFRILKLERSESGDLNVQEDEIVYTKRETNQILNAIDEGNKNSGGLKLKASFWGLLGFIRFTGPYYMLFVTKRSQVAMIGGHYIYQVDATELIPLTPVVAAKNKTDKHPEEARFVSILNNLDLSRSFYFSYSYDVTRTLQHNILREREALQEGRPEPLHHDHNDMFIWNHYLLRPALEVMNNTYDWCLSIVHGYVDQAALSVYWGRTVYITIIARRSRFFAGARYLKRGANDMGYVANDVETEQIVSEMLTTSFHAPGPTLFANPNYTSYVQHRGSIPLYWTQEGTGVSPKPDIELNLVDPFYSTTAMHFDNLFQRYGAPVQVLNLVKAKERTPRESKLSKEYLNAITYLNQFLPDGKKIGYHAFDMSRASKSRDQDVIGSLEHIADDYVPETGIFQNGNDEEDHLKLQHGVIRTNCIDCLDRTNAAQFVLGKKALGHQLYALGVIASPSVDYDSDAVNLFTHMWHDHGDTIAVQYGGSHLVNTMATYRKINQWTSHSRDMVESFKRYYNNSFMDGQRQEAINLFLGNYIYSQGQPMLWDLASDYYLHHSDPRKWQAKRRPSYRNWFTPSNLEQPGIPPAIWPASLSQKSLTFFDDYWLEYYRPLAVSSFKKIFSFKMHSNLRYIPIHSTQEGRYDLSPFKVRHDTAAGASLHSSPRRKGVKIVDPSDTSTIDSRITTSTTTIAPPATPKPSTLGPWLDAQQANYAQLTRRYTGLIKEPSFERSSSTYVPAMPALSDLPLTKAEQAVLTFTNMVTQSLDPVVIDAEEYEAYVKHPLELRLVTTTGRPEDAPAQYAEYMGKMAAVDAEVVDEVENPAKLDAFLDFLEVPAEGLDVLEEDGGKKRYKAYRQWLLRGKSLFKQRPVVGGEVG